MSYSNFLVSKGISKVGAAEVVLGHPLTLASDRAILGRPQTETMSAEEPRKRRSASC
jgi:hypothetical protein